ncbi:hypothetical protein C5613_24770 [Rhodococcus opacus]|uniref:Uncharacterized protein n=1 Tax=Rhodococcus opacus TaxID=37919 RepID=A0A2S8J4M3_RHOOP|nr:hypothetical protein C5613_24770 [Rhodococcus opacus]
MVQPGDTVIASFVPPCRGCSSYGSARVREDIPQLVALADAGRLDLASMVTTTKTVANEAL